VAGRGHSHRCDGSTEIQPDAVGIGDQHFQPGEFTPQNGVLESPLFNQTQSLAGGQFGNPFPANRAILLESTFSF
jgi:hypothetical protein